MGTRVIRLRNRWDWHHVPPRHPSLTTPVKIRVKRKHHEAYHLLFQNAGTLEQCIEILKRDWWPPPTSSQKGDCNGDRLSLLSV